jgi:hypothetical protein
MDRHTRHPHPPRKCDLCDRPMHLLGTVSAVGRRAGRRVYKCTACGYATADAVERRVRPDLIDAPTSEAAT